jgi:hypothetical protein
MRRWSMFDRCLLWIGLGKQTAWILLRGVHDSYRPRAVEITREGRCFFWGVPNLSLSAGPCICCLQPLLLCGLRKGFAQPLWVLLQLQ